MPTQPFKPIPVASAPQKATLTVPDVVPVASEPPVQEEKAPAVDKVDVLRRQVVENRKPSEAVKVLFEGVLADPSVLTADSVRVFANAVALASGTLELK